MAGASPGLVGSARSLSGSGQRELVRVDRAVHAAATRILDFAEGPAVHVIANVDGAATRPAEADPVVGSPPQPLPSELDWMVPAALTSPLPETWIALHAVRMTANVKNGKLRSC